jgi:two-component system, sensor histidine kinase and response regulator
MTERERVLVVDDSRRSRLVVGEQLEAVGFDVVTASSGEEALDIVDDERFDLVVIDVAMPGIGGFETCRRLRWAPRTSGIPVLFLSSDTDHEVVKRAVGVGGDDLLAKPPQSSELVMRARALIRQHTKNIELQRALCAIAEQNEALHRLDYDRRQVSQLIGVELAGRVDALLEMAQPDGEVAVAAARIQRTANELVAWSRARDGELIPRLETFSLRELAAEVASTMRVLTRWNGVMLEMDVRRERVVADREMTRRLLHNLVHSVVKRAPQGTVVTIEADVDTDGLVLRVIDRGASVPLDEIEQMFERFTRNGDSEAERGGLGLAFCRMAAEAHGGRIWIEPRDGHGASFCVRIPQPLA